MVYCWQVSQTKNKQAFYLPFNMPIWLLSSNLKRDHIFFGTCRFTYFTIPFGWFSTVHVISLNCVDKRPSADSQKTGQNIL